MQNISNIQNNKYTQFIKDVSSIFIYDDNRNEYITFKIIPNSMQENYRPTFHQEGGIFGRTTPLYFYTGGGGKTLSFSFTIHEDMLPLTDGGLTQNIYEFLTKLETFMEPTTLNAGLETQTLGEPSVYMQIGDQFAGKGFIDVSWGYKTPFRQGRYILVDVNITFTYRIEYESPIVQLDKYGDEIYTFDFTLDLDTQKFADTHDENLLELLPKFMDYDYLRTYAYEDLKDFFKDNPMDLRYHENSMVVMPVGSGYGKSPVLWVASEPGDAGGLYTSGQYRRMDNYFLTVVYHYYRDLTEIVRPDIPVGSNPITQRITSLKVLKDKLMVLEKIYNELGEDKRIFITDGTTGGYRDPMTKKEKEDFEKALQQLLLIIDTQLYVLQAYSAGGR